MKKRRLSEFYRIRLKLAIGVDAALHGKLEALTEKAKTRAKTTKTKTETPK